MSFETIETQDQLDAIISDRIKREKETLAKKYSDYDDIKSKNADLEKRNGDLSKELSDTKEKLTGHDNEVEALNSKIKGYESASVKTRIALEVGIPFELAGRLTGDDEDAIRKDAEGIKACFGQKKKTPPLRNTEPEGEGGDVKDGYKALLNGLKNED